MSKLVKKNNSKSKKTIHENTVLFVVISGFVLVAIALVGMFNLGLVGRVLTGLVTVFFGSFPWTIYLMLLGFGGYLIATRQPMEFSLKQIWILLALLVAYLLTLELLDEQTTLKGFEVIRNFFVHFIDIFNRSFSARGGFFGALLYALSSVLFDRTGTIVIVILLLLSCFTILYGRVVYDWILGQQKSPKPKPVKKSPIREKVKKAERKPYSRDDLEEFEFKPVDMAEAVKQTQKSTKPIFIDVNDEKQAQNKEQDPINTPVVSMSQNESQDDAKHFMDYQLPSLSILDGYQKSNHSTSNQRAAELKGQRLIEILDQFQISAELIATHIGPAVTKFELRPDPGVKVQRISSLQDNLMMELAVKDLRIEAPIPGKNAVGIEIPNVEMTPVRLSELLLNMDSSLQTKPLLFPLGKDLLGNNIYAELDKMPHLLIAGSTGSGKSVAINSMISSLLLRTRPDEVKLVLIDPKKVEFVVFEDVPHLYAPVISEPVKAAAALNGIVSIMETRYDDFAKVGARNISGYNQIVDSKNDPVLKRMPWIIVIIDELADLMSVAGKEVEGHIRRITQLARAAGIHLVVATQRPSVDVITGIIKTNIPSRIAFAVSSATDSRTILDQSGAEMLLGYGDMLYLPVGQSAPVRIQGVFVSDQEVARVADTVKAIAKPRYHDVFMNLDGVEGNAGFVAATEDPLYDEVRAYVIQAQKASTSLLQRRFGIGYNRAARMVDVLEANGIIGPQQGSRPRDVYITNDDLEQEDELFMD
ncbi:MAG TPA: DNA translocase FtsK [Erysipelothrix sp.]|nr:DNA translocase FtsK [Erysipelothrix sp.]